VLLDPFEEQFHLPARLVDRGDGKCRKCEVVGEKLQPLVGVGVEVADTPQRIRVHFGGLEGGQNDRVIGSDAEGFVHRARIAPLEQDVLLGAYDEERRAQGEYEEPLEIDVAAIQDVERARFRKDLVEDVDVVHGAVGNADKRGDVAMQIQQRVHFDGGLVLAKLGPGEQREAQVDGGRI